MATRLTAKQSKRDRPKSSNGKGQKGQTGEETATSDEIVVRKNATEEEIIRGEDIDALAIDLEAFRKTLPWRPPAKPGVSPQVKAVLVKKAVAKDEEKRSQTRSVTVALRAPPEAKPTHQIISTQPRFDSNGLFISHSLLGSLDDFEDEAIRTANEMGLNASLEMPLIQPPTPSDISAKSSSTNVTKGGDRNALDNWNARMLERRRQQGYISKLLQTTEDQLLMNKGSEYRQTMEQRHIVDKAIPALDCGKGYRVGSEFWRLQEQIGDELTGINLTLTQTEKGNPPPLEQIGIPEAVHMEMGTFWPISTTPINYPWKESPYLAQRSHHLNPVLQDIAPHQPDFSHLQVVGTAIPVQRRDSIDSLRSSSFTEEDAQDRPENPLADLEDSLESYRGPSLQFGGTNACWEGNNDEDSVDLQPINARVTFTSEAGEITTSTLPIINDGTTAIYFSWKSIPKESHLDTSLNRGVQRFYFHTKSGVILPNDCLDFPFTFKSAIAGIFTETWQFETRPVLCRGAPLLVTLRGVALREDKLKKTRAAISADLEHRQAVRAVNAIIDSLIDNVRTPLRSPSPLDANLTDVDVFLRKNPTLHFRQKAFDELRALWRNVNAPDNVLDPSEFEPIAVQAEPSQALAQKERGKKAGGSKESGRDAQKQGSMSTTKIETVGEERLQEMREELERMEIEPWDFCIETIRSRILDIESGNRQEKKMIQLNKIVSGMSAAPLRPHQDNLYNIGYELLARWLDKAAWHADHIRHSLGLPEKSFAHGETVEEDPPQVGETSKKITRARTSNEKVTAKKGDSKGGKRTGSGQAEERPPSKAGKQQQQQQASGRRSRTGSPKKPAPAVVQFEENSTEVTEVKSEVEVPKKNVNSGLERKFKKLLYMHVYDTLSTTIDRMSDLFRQNLE